MISSRLLCIRYTPGLAGSFSVLLPDQIAFVHLILTISAVCCRHTGAAAVYGGADLLPALFLSFLFPAAGPKTERYSPVLSVLHGLPSVLIQPADLPGSQRPENVPAIRGSSVLLVAGSDHILPDCRWPAYFHFSQFIHLSRKYLLKTVFLLHIRIFSRSTGLINISNGLTYTW